MKSLSSTLISLFLLLVACGPQEEDDDEVVDLVGTWKLMEYVDHGAGDTAWSQYSDNIIYLKHITPTHFTWLHYDKDENRMVGTGGGTYTYTGDTYTEDIHFFHPPGSSELGQTIPFTAEFKDGKWYHTGYAKEMEFDPETAEVVVVDSNKIEEIWEKIESEEPHSEIVGTWELVSYKNEEDSIWSEHPGFVGYMKLITPTHFTWVYYNKEGDEVTAEAGGTYTLEEDIYSETLFYQHPPEQNLVGLTIPFDFRMENGKWYHKGWIVRPVIDPETGEQIRVDSSLVEEIWEPYGKEETM